MRPYGERSRFEQAVREKHPASMTDERGATFTPLDEMLGTITPSALHFEVHRCGVPDINPGKHRLLIHGMVDRPVVLSVEEIKRLPSTSPILFIECAGNTGPEWRAPTGKTARATHGLTSCSIPVTKAMDDVLVACGEALRPENGYPLRLIVPGWEGSVNMKWLRRITVVVRPYMTRMESMRHAALLPDGRDSSG